MTNPAPKKKPSRNLINVRMQDHWANFVACGKPDPKSPDYFRVKTRQDRVLGDTYNTVVGIAKNMITKQFGPAGRINLEEVAHEVASPSGYHGCLSTGA
jgi:hypothetical protein